MMDELQSISCLLSLIIGFWETVWPRVVYTWIKIDIAIIIDIQFTKVYMPWRIVKL